MEKNDQKPKKRSKTEKKIKNGRKRSKTEEKQTGKSFLEKSKENSKKKLVEILRTQKLPSPWLTWRSCSWTAPFPRPKQRGMFEIWQSPPVSAIQRNANR